MVELSDGAMTWVAAGDSITRAALHTHGARGWVEHVQERLSWQLGRLTDVVVNTGVSGWRATDVLGAYDFVIGRFAPDVLSLSLGTNDAPAGPDGLGEFRDAMREIVARSAGAQIVLHTPLVASHAGRAARPELPAYCQAVRELAAETGALLVDHEAYWLAEFPDGEAIPWLDDPTHPNGVGHLHLADHTLRTLGLGELTAL
ncbi:SGNH/GDSL hydrolase family protein [Kitasatospora sp. NBC_01300]|uniref:SGNH/GDSL hydrolase family protein n=1 Tax=Kitasatospora sp. NBC_01300 TaxID=2903574 RepID=UPI00352C2205|nr:SGNH/GDSL hydrolase family protein [Kitasatospora sp. NBC_01300]WSK08410.1 SGNH/GDSL hydrolase family protein [Kitasatospora sp. NBC_01300]